MPSESELENQGKQIVVLISKVDALTDSIRILATKFDTFSTGLAVFQKDYYIEHQQAVGAVNRHEQLIGLLREDVSKLECSSDEFKLKLTFMDDIKKIKTVVFGNGDVGLVGRLVSMENWKEGQVWFQRLVVGAIVGQLVLLAVYLIQAIP